MDYLNELNKELKRHHEYQSWMKFTEVEVKSSGLVPRFQSTKGIDTDIDENSLMAIYHQTCKVVLP